MSSIAIDKVLASIDEPSVDALMGCMLIREFVTRLVGVTPCHKYVTFFCCINLIMHCVWAVSLPMRYEKVNCIYYLTHSPFSKLFSKLRGYQDDVVYTIRAKD